MRRARAPFAFAVLVALQACPAPIPLPEAPPPTSTWQPGIMLPSSFVARRGLVDVRGVIHAHSIYSHDACDNAPVDEAGVRDAVCLDDLRRGLCQSRHDFVMFTDHDSDFASIDYPDTLLFQPARGDVLVEHDVAVSEDGVVGAQRLPTANRTTCDDGTVQLIMAGSESGLMPVGLERHATADDTLDGPRTYGSLSIEHATAIRNAGGLVLLAHPEDFSVDELAALPVDGFEMFNLHRNTVQNAGAALELVVRLNDGEPGIAHPDLVLALLMSEDPAYLERWGRVLARGVKRTTTMGTDSHRNTFRTLMADGERVDSFRRMMSGFSNHVLVDADAAAPLDDRALKAGLKQGRVFGVFELFGHPAGFDVTASDGTTTAELGDEAPVGATITVARPTVQQLDTTVEAPAITVRLLRAVDDVVGWQVVATLPAEDGADVLEHVTTQPGAYRAEVRIVPSHLRAFMGFDDEVLLADGRDFVWIYSNAIFITERP